MFYRRFYMLAAILLLLMVLVFTSGCGKKQHVSFTYSFAISPKKGEVLKNVTVYLPFPTKNGKPMMEIYRSLLRDYREYRVKDYPDSKVSLIKTKYGTMLKIYVPQIDARGYGLEGGYGFEEPASNEPFAPRFPLTPRLNPRKLKGYKSGHLCDSYLFAKFDHSKDLGLALNYDISIQSPSILPLDYEPGDNYYSYVGWDRIPGNSETLVKYFANYGWTKVPLADLGYDKE